VNDALHSVVDRESAISWFLKTRKRTAKIFDIITPASYYDQPIPLRHPVVFYEGHIPAFGVNTLLKRGLGQPGVDEKLERLFARGIDPENQSSSDAATVNSWPSRKTVQQYAAAADQAILEALESAEIERHGHPVLGRGQAVFTVIEHEEMHQETLAYMWHQLPFAKKIQEVDLQGITEELVPELARVRVPAGRATLGAELDEVPFGWDNEFPRMVVEVPEFAIDRYNVTNQQYLEFVDAGGYLDPRWWGEGDWQWRVKADLRYPSFWSQEGGEWFWRGMFTKYPLPLSWPVYVTQAEASAYARWNGKRLPTEAEFHRAAYGAPDGNERSHPWGEDPPDLTRGHFGFQGWDPMPVGSFPAGVSAWGIHDLVGNGWEWTSTLFSGFPGFAPMPSYPEYSVDFFDAKHYVVKGASPVTATGLVRRSLRNWFRPHYSYLYAGFRCVEDL